MSWEYDLLSEELKESKQLSIGISRGLRDVQSSLKAAGLRPARQGRAWRAADRAPDRLAPGGARQGRGGRYDGRAALLSASDVAATMRVKAAVNPAMMTTAGYAAELVQQGNADFVMLVAAPAATARSPNGR